MKNRLYFPMFIDLKDKPVLVVGAGTIAERRIRALMQFTRNIIVVAPASTAGVAEMGRLGQIEYHRRPVKRTDLRDVYLAVVCTSDRKLNDDIYRICKEEGIYVNVSSDRDKCDFYFPGVYIQDDLVIGITASGLNQRKAKIVKEEMQKALQRIHERVESYVDD